MKDPFAEPADTREEILGAAYRALCAHGYSALTIQRIGDEFEKSPSLLYHHYDGKDELLVDLLEFLLDGFEDALSDGTCAGDVHSAVERDDDEVPTETFDAPPRERVEGYVRAMCDPGSLDDDRAPDDRFLRAVVELRAQAAHDEAYREHFDRSDRVFQRYLEVAVQEAAVEMRGSDADAERTDAVADAKRTDAVVDAERTDAVADAGRTAAAAEQTDVLDVDEGCSDRDHEPLAAREVAATVQTVAIGGMLRWATTTDREWIGDTLAGVDRYLDAALPKVSTED